MKTTVYFFSYIFVHGCESQVRHSGFTSCLTYGVTSVFARAAPCSAMATIYFSVRNEITCLGSIFDRKIDADRETCVDNAADVAKLQPITPTMRCAAASRTDSVTGFEDLLTQKDRTHVHPKPSVRNQ